MQQDSSSHTYFRAGTTLSDSPNPLRPYYIPPSIGVAPDPKLSPASNESSGISGSYSYGTTSPRSKATGFQNTSREFLPNLDYTDYLPERPPSLAETVKSIVDQALWSYTSVLLAHPFEVAKTLMQCRAATEYRATLQPKGQAASTAHGRQSRSYPRRYGDERNNVYHDESYLNIREETSDDSDSDSPSYFRSNSPLNAPQYYSEHSPSDYSTPLRQPRSGARHYTDALPSPSRSHSTTPTPGAIPSAKRHTKLTLQRPNAVLDVIAQLWQREAAWGIWKGTNATFIYNVLLRTIESWMRSLLAALMNLPESAPAIISLEASTISSGSGVGTVGSATLNILDSPSPVTSLVVTVAAAGLTALMLSPLDIIRTRLIVTSTTTIPRAIIPSLRLLPSFATIQARLAPAVLWHSLVPSLWTNAAPLLLRDFLRIDPLLTPTLHSVASFATAVTELFIRLPFETVLRRGQAALLEEQARMSSRLSSVKANTPSATVTSNSRQGITHRASIQDDFETIIDLGPYKGVFGTMWYIVREEGSSPSPAATQAAGQRNEDHVTRTSKGQGFQGLCRGWRVGFWGLVGMWGAATLGSGTPGGEF